MSAPDQIAASGRERRDLVALIDAARIEIEAQMNEASAKVDGKIADSRVWFELRSLDQMLTRASHTAAQIARMT